MNLSGKKALIMGLGLHGGGLESAQFALKRGAEVTVTDLRGEDVLAPSIEKLDAFCRKINSKPVRYVLGKHNLKDFERADVVIKNPGVRPDSPYLLKARKVETDISLFLNESPARLFAVTGTKGKSGTAAALHRILTANCAAGKRENGKVFLGGNITVSPLTFLDELTSQDDIVLELSSFQLGDLKGRRKDDGSPLLKPAAAVITAIMPDHLDRYATMNEYIDDKRVIYKGQDSSCFTIAGDDEWGKSFLKETKGQPVICSLNSELAANLLPHKLPIPGDHQRINLLAAALAVYHTEGGGVKTAETILSAVSSFKGIEHRLEFFYEAKGIKFYNDSAATIPEAAAACIGALSKDAPLALVTGGTDKNLDFSPLVNEANKASAVILLAGTGSDKLTCLFKEKGIAHLGPFNNLEEAVRTALDSAEKLKKNAESVNIALSPGCASFGMFLNEFDRGRKWKESVQNILLDQ